MIAIIIWFGACKDTEVSIILHHFIKTMFRDYVGIFFPLSYFPWIQSVDSFFSLLLRNIWSTNKYLNQTFCAILRSSFVVQQVKNLVLSPQQLRSLLWRMFSPWLRNINMPLAWQKNCATFNLPLGKFIIIVVWF